MLNALKSDNIIKNIGHAGTSMRFLTGYYSGREGRVRMTGSQRMKERPIGELVDALRLLGADIKYTENEGFPPLDIMGMRLEGGEITIDGGISSQFISALLMQAPGMKKGLTLHLKGNIVSSSYINMTLKLMALHGTEYKWEGNTIEILPGNYTKGDYKVESDWSAASYWFSMVNAESGSELELSHLFSKSLQGDSALTKLYKELGVKSKFREDTLIVSKDSNIEPDYFSYDFTDCPDLVQTLAVGLCMDNIPFKFTGTQTLKLKETDRILALQAELKKLGYLLESNAEGSMLIWNKRRCTPEPNPIIDTYHDHRMAMAFAPVAMTKKQVNINDPMVVTKSYPSFWNHLRDAGFEVEVVK
jgi:3-phosphoshikimate 1-carboxyvinyltransferase